MIHLNDNGIKTGDKLSLEGCITRLLICFLILKIILLNLVITINY